MAVTVPCRRCGEPLTLGKQEQAFLAAGKPVAVEHEPGACPHERAAALAEPKPVERAFRAVVSILEVLAPSIEGDLDGLADDVEVWDGQVVRRMTEVYASVTAPSFDAALEPLGDQLAAKWQEAAKYAQLADVEAVPESATEAAGEEVAK